MSPRAILMVMAMAAALAGCAENPVTGRRSVQLISPTAERALGAQALTQSLRGERVVTDPVFVGAVQRVGSRLVRGMGDDPSQWRFVVVDDPSPNAYALPGGNVVVHTGMFPIAANDEGLATVMAHEIGHVVARHGSERASRNVLTQLGVGVLSSMLGGGPMAQVLGTGAQLGLSLPAERRQELEADHMGLVLMERAGYDPAAALGFWQRMAGAANRSGAPEFLSSHPADATRIRALQQLIPQVRAGYG
jgi:predicted Zn-dependent protease